MDFTEFFAIAKDVGRVCMAQNENRAYYENKWVTAGVTGGSCWDDGTEDHHYSVEGEPEPPFTELDDLLLKVCPTLSFLLYKKITNTVIETDSDTDYEYYGNSTTYAYRRVPLKELYNLLSEYDVLK